MENGDRIMVKRPGLKTEATEYTLVDSSSTMVQVSSADNRTFWMPREWVLEVLPDPLDCQNCGHRLNEETDLFTTPDWGRTGKAMARCPVCDNRWSVS